MPAWHRRRVRPTARVNIGLAGFLIASLAGCGGSPATSTPPKGSVVATAKTAPSPVAPTASPVLSPAPQIGWRAISTPSDLGSAQLRDLAPFQGSLVAVGATDDALGVIWSTTDGQAWMSSAGPTTLDGMLLAAVAVGDPGIVVVGWSETDAIALFSPDGISWSRQQVPGSHPGSSIVAVAWQRGRFVAVGGGGEPGAAVSWMSTDGRVWTRVSIIEEGNQESLNGVAAGPDGFVVDGTHRGRAAVWTSSDGNAWKRTDLPGSTADDPGRLRYAGGHFFLPVTGGDLFTSTDGQLWLRTTVPGFGVGVFDVASIPGGFIAVGRSSEGSQPGVVATSDGDLTRWTLQPADPVFDGALAVGALAWPDGAQLVGIGNSLSGESVFLLADPAALVNP